MAKDVALQALNLCALDIMPLDADLQRKIIHDHASLNNLLDGLEHSLTLQVEGGDTSPQPSTFFEEARADLSFVLDEMLEHFGIEEEAIFQQIAEALPQMIPRIEALEKVHEELCASIVQLRKILAVAQPQTWEPQRSLTILQKLQRMIRRHNQQEVRVFLDALEQLDEVQQQQLLEDLNRI